MILHPGILSLLLGSITVAVMMIYASLLGIKIVLKWDYNSSSAAQLALERKTYLVSTIVKYVLLFEVLSLFLFIYTADDIRTMFMGAMCASGSLNANPVGWSLLYIKIIVFFLSATWIVLSSVDEKAEDYPLVRLKYALLLFIAPVVMYDLYLQFHYFTGLDPNVITACCGALFDEEGAGVASTIAFYPVKPMMIAFYSAIALCVLGAGLSWKYKSGLFKYLFGLSSASLFAVSLASVISFISVYHYQVPTHHCPFDIIQKDYNYIGYPMYAFLFTGSFFGMITGLLNPLKNISSLNSIISEAQRKWIAIEVVCVLSFALISSWPIVFSEFSLY